MRISDWSSDVCSSDLIIAGERRWRAAQRAQLHRIPAIVRDFNDAETLEIALIENIQREDLNPIEEAEAYRKLIAEFGHSQEALSRLVGKSRSHVRSEEHTSELQSLMRISYAVFCLKKNSKNKTILKIPVIHIM